MAYEKEKPMQQKKPEFDRLVIERSQPVQGQRVDATLTWNDTFVGELQLPFKAWLKFKRLLEKGLEMDAREDHGLLLRLSIRGGAQPTGIEDATAEDADVRVNLPEAEDTDDAEDLAAIAAAEAGSLPQTNELPEHVDNGDGPAVTQGLIRSLRRENADG